MAESNLPTLRIRCPKCHTVMRVTIGSLPTCVQCGFSGRGTAAPRAALAAAPAWTDAPDSGDAAAPVESAEAWGEAPPEEGWTEVAPEAAPAEAGWNPEGGDEWQEAPAEPWPEAEPAPPAKKAIFKRK